MKRYLIILALFVGIGANAQYDPVPPKTDAALKSTSIYTEEPCVPMTIDCDDCDSTNEIQSLSISNDTIYLSDGGYVTLPVGSHAYSYLYNTGDGVYHDTTNNGIQDGYFVLEIKDFPDCGDSMHVYTIGNIIYIESYDKGVSPFTAPCGYDSALIPIPHFEFGYNGDSSVVYLDSNGVTVDSFSMKGNPTDEIDRFFNEHTQEWLYNGDTIYHPPHVYPKFYTFDGGLHYDTTNNGIQDGYVVWYAPPNPDCGDSVRATVIGNVIYIETYERGISPGTAPCGVDSALLPVGEDIGGMEPYVVSGDTIGFVHISSSGKRDTVSLCGGGSLELAQHCDIAPYTVAGEVVGFIHTSTDGDTETVEIGCINTNSTYTTYTNSYPTSGVGVPNGSTFKGSDGDLYYKNDSGIVTKLN